MDEQKITVRWNKRWYTVAYRWRPYPNPLAYPDFEVVGIIPEPRPSVKERVVSLARFRASCDRLSKELEQRRKEIRALIGKWVEVRDRAAQRAAIALSRGPYQTALLYGEQSLSGSTLKGRARRYAAHYARSRQRLLDRLTAAGIKWAEKRGPHGRRVLVLG